MKDKPEEKWFTCKGCNYELTDDYNLRTEGWCFLCDPNITLYELLSDEPLPPTNQPPATV